MVARKRKREPRKSQTEVDALARCQEFATKYSDEPEAFVEQSDELKSSVKAVLADLYKHAKANERFPLGELDELFTEGFDHEQIWEMVQIQNRAINDHSKVLLQDDLDLSSDDDGDGEAQSSGNENELYSAEDGSEGEDLNDEDQEMEDGDEDENEEDEEEARDDGSSEGEDQQQQPKPKGVASELDDGFFDLNALDDFLNYAEKEDGWVEDEQDDANEEEEEEEEEEGGAAAEDGDADDDEEDEFGLLKKLKRESKMLDDSSDDEGDGEEQNVDGDSGEEENYETDFTYKDFFAPPERKLLERAKQRAAVSEDRPEQSHELEEEEEDGGDDDMRGDEGDDGEEQDPAEEELGEDGGSADGSEEAMDEEAMSRHERQVAAMRAKIAKLEEHITSEKEWAMKGEATATSRPENSLLEVDIEHDNASKVAPQITEETTKTLEDIIKQRILDESWDDVIRKQEPKERKFKPREEISQEKSKMGLGEVYEKEFLKSSMGVEEPDELAEKHKEITNMFTSLCAKLDALASFHYTPTPVVEDLSVKANAPAISMEEKIPVAVSDAALLAPEEVLEKPKTDVKGETELTKEERKRLRAAKKAHKQQREKERKREKKFVEKLNPGMGNKHSKEKALKEIQEAGHKNTTIIGESAGASYTKSSSVFQKLQDEAKKKVKSVGESSKRKKPKFDSKKLMM